MKPNQFYPRSPGMGCRIITPLAAIFAFLFITFSAVAQDAVFEVDSLNQGLSGDRSELDLETPQSSIETFLAAVEDEDWDTAAQVLDLRDIDVAAQGETGPRLAELLSVVLDRKVVISWNQLLERPDALDANAPSKDPMAGQPRKSLLLGLVELGDRNVAVRLNRLKPEGEAAVWVFSRQTVGNVEALFAEHGPTEFEAALPDWMRAEGPGGLMWWELLGIPVILIAAGAAGWVAWRSFGWMSERTPVPFTRAILRGARMPATLAFIALVLQVATDRFFVVSGVFGNIIDPVIVLLTVSAVVILIVNILDALLDKLTPDDVTDMTDPDAAGDRSRVTTVSAIRRIFIIIAVVGTTGFVLAYANVFQLLGFSLLAASGGLLFVLGFAAREVVGNILASLQIALNRSARIGDQIIYDGHLCTVERIHFTFVQLHVWDDTRLIVPVLKFVSDEFVNRNIEHLGMTRTVTLKISNRTDLDRLREMFRDYMATREAIEAEDANMLVTGQDEVGIDVRFAIPVPDPTAGWDEEVALREAMIKAVQNLEEEQDDDLVPHMGLSANRRAQAQDAAYDDDGVEAAE